VVIRWPQARVRGLLHRHRVDANARGVWHCASFAAPVSMEQSATETGGETRSTDLRREGKALLKDATTERRPIGSTDEPVRCVAFTIRSAFRVPVHPGGEILATRCVMSSSMPDASDIGTRKIEPDSEGFSLDRSAEDSAADYIVVSAQVTLK